MNEFFDIIEKLKYYKELVLKEFIARGIYPDNKLIEAKVSEIDLHTSIFRHHPVVPGDLFDVDEYNNAMLMIYEDIKILYSILNKLQIEEYEKQRNFINSYLAELNNIAYSYKYRAEFENSTTTLGKTVLFQDSSFNIQNDNSTTIITMEDVEIEEASELACIANIHSVDPENMIIVLESEDGEENVVSPFNYTGDTLVLKGEKETKIFEVSIPEDQKINGPILLNIDTKISHDNNYTVLGGKNKVLVSYKDSNRFSLDESPSTLGTNVYNKNSFINFYIVNGNSVSFKFNKKPKSSNFKIDEQVISNLNPIHHFFIECDDNFTFEIELDRGTLYATKEEGIINNGKLYYTSVNDIRDFSVIEESLGEKKLYHPKVKIFNNNNDNYEIESIIIKKIT